MKKGTILILSLATMLISACYSDAEIAKAKKVITALPTEVSGCTFLGDVDVGVRANIENARFELLYKASLLNATHLVETHAYAGAVTYRLVGVALSGRAYKCPQGLGPILTKDEAKIKFDIPPEHLVFPDDPFDFDD